MPLAQKLHVACVQLCSTHNIEENLGTIAHQLKAHQQQNFQLVVLPENATLITDDPVLKQQAAQKPSYHKIFSFFSQQAKLYNTWLVAGSLLIQDESNPHKFFNHCPVFSPNGDLLAHYNKIHLFDADLKTEAWQESALITAGSEPTTISLDQNWKVGLSICYDLRFPELYRHYSQSGCNIMTVPAAFTVPTGKAHWQTLLQTRAIENQSFILAAGQTGSHHDGRQTYGHSMIIDPWGKVIATIAEGEGIISAHLSLSQLQQIQQRMPVLQHRRL